MPQSHCQSIRDLLVDFCDGELGETDSRVVEGHLNDCAHCREQVARLRSSLEIAQSIWRDAGSHNVTVPLFSIPRRRRRALVVRAVFSVAAILVVAMGLWFAIGEHRQDKIAELPIPRDPLPQEQHITEPIDVEAILFREEQAARLAASLQILAAHPELAEFHQSAEKYLADTYGLEYVSKSTAHGTSNNGS